MRRLILIITASCFSIASFAQEMENENKVVVPPMFTFNVNYFSGNFSDNFGQAHFPQSYKNYVNDNISEVKTDNRHLSGYRVDIGYFWGKEHHWGLGLGIMSTTRRYDLSVNSFHIEYQSLNYINNNYETFRQVLNANKAIIENIKATNLSVPLSIKYRNTIAGKFGYAVDAGFLLTISNSNEYKANALFDYESIYKYVTNADNQKVAVYDPSAIPDKDDWIIARESKYTISEINDFHNQGYNVGLDVAYNNTGKVDYKARSLGWFIQPAISYNVTKNFSLSVGCMLLKQAFINKSYSNSYQITDKIGQYNSLLNSVSTTKDFTFGFNVGVHYSIIKKAAPAVPKEEVIN